MRNLLAVLFPALTLAFAGCAAMPPSTPAEGTDAVERNKALVRELTEVVWNQRGLDRIPDFYGPDFVGDYRPYALRLRIPAIVISQIARIVITPIGGS